MDEALRTKVCRLVAGLVVADDDLDEKEDAFITRVLAKYDLHTLPVVDQSGEMLGVITSDDILDVIHEEHSRGHRR